MTSSHKQCTYRWEVTCVVPLDRPRAAASSVAKPAKYQKTKKITLLQILNYLVYYNHLQIVSSVRF